MGGEKRWPPPQRSLRITIRLSRRHQRSGYFNGARVGWAPVLGGNPANAIVLKVDVNGDKKPDVSCGPSGLFDGTSYLYEASPSPKRAFKACVKLSSDFTGPCHPNHQTGWR